MKIRCRSSSKGIALIVVMLSIFVLAVLAGAFAFSMKVETTLARNSDFESHLEWLGRSGVEYAKWILAEQAKCPNQPYEALNQVWAGGSGDLCATNGPLAMVEQQPQLGQGTISWKITDLERKFNINVANHAVLMQAMTIMGVDASLTPTIADSILDWIDPDGDTHLSGAESDFYLGLGIPYVSKNGPIEEISELLLLKGILDHPEIYWGTSNTNYTQSAFVARDSNRPFADPNQPTYPVGFVDIFTTLSSGRININTATMTTLQMIPGIDENIAMGIVQRRSGVDGVEGTEDDDPFRSVGELVNVPGMQNPTQLRQFCDVRSHTFEVEIDVNFGGVNRKYVAVVRRGTRGGEFATLKFRWK